MKIKAITLAITLIFTVSSRLDAQSYEHTNSREHKNSQEQINSYGNTNPYRRTYSLEQVIIYDHTGDMGLLVTINQSQKMKEAMECHIQQNRLKKNYGYRIRIFFDNKQSARNNSETILNRFMELFPDIPAYRSYSNPYFTVSVGDFKNKSEAVRTLELIKPEFPNALVLRDNIL